MNIILSFVLGVGHGEGLEALEGLHWYVGCDVRPKGQGGDVRPQGEGGNGHGDGVGHGKSREALEGAHGHVGGDVRPQGEGSDGHGDELPVVKVWSLQRDPINMCVCVRGGS